MILLPHTVTIRTSLLRGSICFALAISLAIGQAVDTSDRDYWNSKFKDPNTQFNRQPSRLLIDVVRNRKPGLAIDLGMGEGRNAIYLAQHGWQVTGVDLSDVAVAQAKKRATALQVNFTAIVDGLDHYDFGKDRWDLISLFYLHAWYHNVKPKSVQRLFNALKPGGVLVIEGFAGKEGFMFQPNELLRISRNYEFCAMRTSRMRRTGLRVATATSSAS